MFRHAKSDWKQDYGGNDLDRPLANRGRRAAKIAGQFIAAAGQVPDLVLVSPALRARQTVEIASSGATWKATVRLDDRLYGDADGLLESIRQAPESARTLMIVGHEPAWSEVASRLTNGAAFILPTASVLRLDFEVDRWAEVVGRGKVVWLVTPRLIRTIRSSGFPEVNR